MADGDPTGFDARPVPGRSFRWKQAAAVAWLLTTVALAGWWMLFGLQQLDHIYDVAARGVRSGAEVSTQELEQRHKEIIRHHRMLTSEGTVLIILLLVGGGSLLYYIQTEVKRAGRIQEFFAAFTHDMKTSLASLRLQAESLEEDLRESGQGKLARRLVKDTVRLELQLENSLLLASPDDSRLLLEDIWVSDVIQPMRHHWPDLEIVQRGDGLVRADSRALESIFKNLLQNAVVHGRSTRVDVSVETGEPGRLRIRFEDNGRGFLGDRNKLGKMFLRHSSTSGSGLGLYLAIRLAARMEGDLRVCQPTDVGFCVELSLPGQEEGLDLMAPRSNPETSAEAQAETSSEDNP